MHVSACKEMRRKLLDWVLSPKFVAPLQSHSFGSCWFNQNACDCLWGVWKASLTGSWWACQIKQRDKSESRNSNSKGKSVVHKSRTAQITQVCVSRETDHLLATMRSNKQKSVANFDQLQGINATDRPPHAVLVCYLNLLMSFLSGACSWFTLNDPFWPTYHFLSVPKRGPLHVTQLGVRFCCPWAPNNTEGRKVSAIGYSEKQSHSREHMDSACKLNNKSIQLQKCLYSWF